MERDALLAHGTVKFLKEKLMDNSDPYTVWICGKCGLFAKRVFKKESKAYSTVDDTYFCQACNNYNDIFKVRMPYAMKLFTQELRAMNIAARFRRKKNLYEL